MKLKILVVFILFINMNIGFSQTKTDSSTLDEGKNYVGINMGGTTGMGLSYIYWPAKDGMQITFLPLIDKHNTYISAGLTFMHQLKQYKQTTFFIYWGNHITNIFSDNYVLDIGVGPGVKYKIYDFYINFMVGYAIFGLGGNTMVRPTGELGVFYRF